MKRSPRLIVVEDRGGELVVGDDAKEIADQPVSRNVSLRGLLAERKDEPDALIQGF